MLRETIYPKLKSTFESWANALHANGITPNQLTIAGVVLSFIAGYLFAVSNLFVGLIMMILGGICDAVDGPLARVSQKGSPFGAFLDSTMDRFSDGFLFGGLALHFYNTDEPFWIAICIGLIISSFVVSYAKARSENFIENCKIGIFTRETRWALVGVGVLFSFILKPVLFVAFVGSTWTVYQRIMYTKAKLSKPETLAEPDAAI